MKDTLTKMSKARFEILKDAVKRKAAVQNAIRGGAEITKELRLEDRAAQETICLFDYWQVDAMKEHLFGIDK